MERQLRCLYGLRMISRFFFSSRRRHTRSKRDWSSDVCSSDLYVEGINKGNRAPDFKLQTLDGQTVALSDFRGKKVIVNMWATWCPPCRAEMPDMQRSEERRVGKECKSRCEQKGDEKTTQTARQ